MADIEALKILAIEASKGPKSESAVSSFGKNFIYDRNVLKLIKDNLSTNQALASRFISRDLYAAAKTIITTNNQDNNARKVVLKWLESLGIYSENVTAQAVLPEIFATSIAPSNRLAQLDYIKKLLLDSFLEKDPAKALKDKVDKLIQFFKEILLKKNELNKDKYNIIGLFENIHEYKLTQLAILIISIPNDKYNGFLTALVAIMDENKVLRLENLIDLTNILIKVPHNVLQNVISELNKKMSGPKERLHIYDIIAMIPSLARQAVDTKVTAPQDPTYGYRK